MDSATLDAVEEFLAMRAKDARQGFMQADLEGWVRERMAELRARGTD